MQMLFQIVSVLTAILVGILVWALHYFWEISYIWGVFITMMGGYILKKIFSLLQKNKRNKLIFYIYYRRILEMVSKRYFVKIKEEDRLRYEIVLQDASWYMGYIIPFIKHGIEDCEEIRFVVVVSIANLLCEVKQIAWKGEHVPSEIILMNYQIAFEVALCILLRAKTEADIDRIETKLANNKEEIAQLGNKYELGLEVTREEIEKVLNNMIDR